MVGALLGGPQRFDDLPGQIPGIAANILSERLKRWSSGQGRSPALMIEARSASVSRLVAVGRSNREISAELFISVKTVSVHVSGIVG